MNFDKFTIYASRTGMAAMRVIGTAETREQAETFVNGALASYCYTNGKTEEDIRGQEGDDVFSVGELTLNIETDW